MSEGFWGITARDIVMMEYEDVATSIREASGYPDEKLIPLITKRRMESEGDLERLACSRILCAILDKPDIMYW